MKISPTARIIALSLPAGALLAVISHGIVHTGADTLDPAAAAVGITTAAAGLGSLAFFGTKAAIELHADTVRDRRHRAERPRTAPASSRAGTHDLGSFIDELANWQPAADMRQRPAAAPAEPEPEQVPAEPDHPARAEALAAERDAAPAYVDPYLTPAEPADTDWPDDVVRAIDEFADLYAHPAAP